MNNVTTNLDLSRYTENELYNMLTSGLITRREYLSEMGERGLEGQADADILDAARDRAYDEWKARRFD